MLVNSMSLEAFFAFLLMPIVSNALFESCSCPPLPAANGTVGSANCQTGATCDPTNLRENACVVSCVQPWSRPLYKSGLSWLTADKVNCTGEQYYANNKVIKPTMLNCKDIPRCDECPYTMAPEFECPPNFYCSQAVRGTNSYSNCLYVHCPSGTFGEIKHPNGTVTKFDSTLTCTTVNKQWKDYNNAYYTTPQLSCKAPRACPTPSVIYEVVPSSFHLKLGTPWSNRTHAWCDSDLLGYIDNGTTYRQINGPVVLTCDSAAGVWRLENGVIMGTVDLARLMCSEKRCKIPSIIEHVDPAYNDVLGLDSVYYYDNYIGCPNDLAVYVVRKVCTNQIVAFPWEIVAFNTVKACDALDDFKKPLTMLPSAVNYSQISATSSFYCSAFGSRVHACPYSYSFYLAENGTDQANFYNGTTLFPIGSYDSYELYSGGQMVVHSDTSRAISCVRPLAKDCTPLEVLYHNASGYLPDGYVLDPTANPVHSGFEYFQWSCIGGQSAETVLVFSDGVSSGMGQIIECSRRGDLIWNLYTNSMDVVRLPETGVKIFCAIPANTTTAP